MPYEPKKIGAFPRAYDKYSNKGFNQGQRRSQGEIKKGLLKINECY